MILVALDKFKGTLTARQACDIAAEAIGRDDIVKAPMADGGEGTAEALCRGRGMDRHDTYWVDRRTRTAVIDSSAVIGLQMVDPAKRDILRASSAPLGIKVREIIKGGCEKVVIGIGGTSTCDGGMGFLQALGMEKLGEYRHRLVGLSDVHVPLVAEGDAPSALMFAPQKGASPLDIEVLRRRLERLYAEYPGRRSPYDGAGGGLGFAIASVIGAPCHDGAGYVLQSYGIDWPRIEMIVTGEGRIDRQTDQGKVVGTLRRVARERGIPIVAFGGTVEPGAESANVIATDRYHTTLPLDTATAALRLRTAVEEYFRR